MIKVRAINHVALRISDPKRSQDFYVNVLGLKVAPLPPMSGEMRERWAKRRAASGTPVPTGGLWIEAPGGVQLHLIAAPEKPGGGINSTGPHVALEVHDIDQARRALEEQGLDYLAGPDGAPFEQLWFVDPDGSTIELWAARRP